ncbi:Bacterioferritin-associated ferredoxin [Rubellimicrobium thermophilum DSM 16684]|uniref:Bacterioferritin-associated ferredoxin n=2 Tax=Rubellimicrobium TaxID=295418 RepID=S9QYK8_9RHOB|nr:Bacterioferritin-associated ferredoxin [Rubellimicrobium thermophilum DSM 16684]
MWMSRADVLSIITLRIDVGLSGVQGPLCILPMSGPLSGMSAMIVCHCTGITDSEIHAAIDWMRAADPTTLITPGKVYRALGKRADCGGCLPLFLATMQANANLKVPQGIPVLRARRKDKAG